MYIQTNDTQIPNSKKVNYITLFLVLVCLGALTLYLLIRVNNTSPRNFPLDTDITIDDGMNHTEIVDHMEEVGLVRSSLLLHLALTHFFAESFVLAGIYNFPEPLTTYEIAQALTTGMYKTPALRLTLPEGFSVRDFYSYVPQSYAIETEIDLSTYEGYLFPDTYFITNEMSLDDVVTLLRETMNEKLQFYKDPIDESGFDVHEVLTLASIIEREANDEESMKLVSGILQNRLAIGMALQVDATLDYLFDKTSAELTVDDLAYDSPYNTYLYRGLPPTPIANPGINSIEAVLYPTKSDYLYYLTGNDGNFYYARTFEEHVRNKERYLR